MLSLKESSSEEYNNDIDIFNSTPVNQDDFIKYFNKYFIEFYKTETANTDSDSNDEIIYKKSDKNNSENKKNNNIIKIENNNEFTIKKKRGRKKLNDSNNLKNNFHSKDEIGNICSKIKNNFHNYIIEFFNHKIREKNNGKQIVKFRKIKYDITNIRNKTANKNLLKLPIKNILKYNISSKYKNSSEDQNYQTLMKIYPMFSEYLEMSYEDFYKIHYLNNKNKENISHKHSFINFIQNSKNKDEIRYHNKLIEISYKYIDYYNKKIEKKNKKLTNDQNFNSLFTININ